MSLLSVDQLWYYGFSHGLQTFSYLPILDSLQFISSYKIDKHTASLARRQLGNDFYSVSAVGIFKRDFFLSVLTSKRPFLKRFSKNLPFDFEKKSFDFVSPLIITAFPKKELFASIDDDHGTPGYSLIARGVYPNRVSRDDLIDLEYSPSRYLGSLQLLPTFIRQLVVSVYILTKRIGYTLSYYFSYISPD